MASQKPKLEESELVAKLRVNRDKPGDLTVLAGYLGKSDRDGYWRLYPTADMKDYLEIAESDIVHSQSLETQDNPLGGTMLWVNRDAEIVCAQTDRLSAQTGFLSGNITSSMLRTQGVGNIGTGGYGVTGPQCIFATITIVTMSLCRTTILDCQSEDCFSAPVLCTIGGYPGCPPL